MFEQSGEESRKGRRSVTFSQQAEEAGSELRADSAASLVSQKYAVLDRIIANLRNMMVEEGLDIVQKNALASLKATLGDESEKTEQALAMFSLASQLSAESVHLGYKPNNLFTTILAVYCKASEEYTATAAKFSEEEADSNEEISGVSDMTKLLSVEFKKSPIIAKVCSVLIAFGVVFLRLIRLAECGI